MLRCVMIVVVSSNLITVEKQFRLYEVVKKIKLGRNYDSTTDPTDSTDDGVLFLTPLLAYKYCGIQILNSDHKLPTL